MVKLLVVLGFIGTTVGLASAADATSPIDLGGIRQAQAILTITDTDYVLKVRMLPVQCFDDATNARLNWDKARELALQGLAKHLSGKKVIEFFISGAQVEKTGTDGKFYTLALRVPLKGVSVVRAGEKLPAKAADDRVAFTSELFTRKKDYLNTLNKLMAGVASDVQKTEDKAGESFKLTLSEIEERGLKNLANLGKEIEGDLLLLSVEKEELNEALDKANKTMLVRLREAVKRNQTKEKSP